MLWVVGGYLLLTLIVGVAFSARVRSASDYLIAGRHLGLALSTASLAAVQIGAGIVMGGAETAAASGLWPGVWYGIGCGGGLILAGWLAAGRLRQAGGYVPIDYFAARYGEFRSVRMWAWLSNVPSLLGIFAAQLMAAGGILSGFGFSFSQSVIGIGAVILVSNAMSGMWGVVAVDFVQVAIIAVGIPVAAAAALANPASGTVASLTLTPFIPTGMGTRAVFLITPFLFSISVSYDAFIRYQAARSVPIARRACVLAGLLVFAVSFGAALLGAAGRNLFPDAPAGTVLVRLITTTLPTVVGGVVISALLAAAMSTANALLVSLAGCFSRDFYNKVLHPDRELDDLPNATRLVRLAAAGAVVLGVLAALTARGILDTIIIFAYPYMASMLVPLLGGLLWSRGTTRGAFAAMVAGGLIGVAAFAAGAPGPFHGLVNIDLALLVAFGVSAIVYVVVSLATEPAPVAEEARP
ncbi:MAG: sodium:solute symporter [Gemmatimonadales bacterium]